MHLRTDGWQGHIAYHWRQRRGSEEGKAAALTFVSTVGNGTKCFRASCVFVFEQSLQLDARPSLDDRT